MKRRKRGRRAAAQWASNEYFALRTYRADGSAVTTPIWLAPSAGLMYGYTPGRSWKVRRIVRNPCVEVAASDFHGVTHGPWQPGRARVLGQDKRRVAMRAMSAKYGLRFWYFTAVLFAARRRRAGGRAVGVEITLDTGPDR